MNVRTIALTACAGKAGRVIPVGEASVPFAIRRVYFIRDIVPEAVAGRHALRRGEAVFICAHGRCSLRLDDGREKIEHSLELPDQALYIGAMIWREVYGFSPDCVLLVLASEVHDPGDYIHDYAAFLRACREPGRT